MCNNIYAIYSSNLITIGTIVSIRKRLVHKFNQITNLSLVFFLVFSFVTGFAFSVSATRLVAWVVEDDHRATDWHNISNVVLELHIQFFFACALLFSFGSNHLPRLAFFLLDYSSALVQMVYCLAINVFYLTLCNRCVKTNRPCSLLF